MLLKDRVAASRAAIEKLFANPDTETAELIKQAQEDYDSEYIFILIFHTRVCSLSICTKSCTRVHFHGYTFVIDLPAGHQLHNVMVLLNFDASKLCGKTLGAASVRKHQELLQQHWGSGEVTTLPREDIQRCLLGVRIPDFFFLYFPFRKGCSTLI